MIPYKIITLVITSGFPYSFNLIGDFVFDDSEAILKNKDVTSDSWVDLFENDFWGSSIRNNASHKSYRPLTIISFRINYFLNNKVLSATQFKITNLICHMYCCILLWFTYNVIWRRLTKRSKSYLAIDVPYLASLLFSVHPVHVEAVSGIVGRADVLAAITFLSSFLLYNSAVDKGNVYLLASILFAGFSMLFKENGLTVLGVCLVYEMVINVNIKKQSYTKLKCFNAQTLKRLAVVTISIILFLYGRWTIMEGTKPEFKPTDNPTAFSNKVLTKIATYSYIYLLNGVLLVWPQWLCYDWSMGCVPLIEEILDFRILFVLLFYSFAILIIKKIVQKSESEISKRLLILALALAVAPFLPATNIFYSVGFVIAERVLYIPSAGFCLMVCVGLNKIITYRRNYRKVIIAFYFFTLFVFALRTWQRSFDWQNEYKLFTKGLSVCPLNAKVHYNVAKVADASRRTEWAIAEYKTAIRLYPEYYQAMNNVANLLKDGKKFEEAESYLQSALRYKTDFPAAWMNLGIVLASIKRYTESEKAYKTALTYRRNYPDCYYNLGNLYLEMNKIDKAKDNWLIAIDMNSTHVSAWTNLLALLDNKGYISTALQMIPKALQMLPNSASINFSVANIYGKLEKYEMAEQYFLKAIKLFGSRVNAIHYANLGVLYHRWKRYKSAADMYKVALKLDPNFTSASKNLNSVNKLLKLN